MPELPEVETIRRGLEKWIVRKKIARVEVWNAKSFLGETKEVVGAKIEEIGRRGKALLVKLDNGRTMMVHLRMTGQMIFVGEERFAGGHPNENFVEELPNKQTRVIFVFTSGENLFFNDQRKFGFIKVLKDEEVEEESFLRALGKEPWEMTGRELYEKLEKKKMVVKAALLDQKIVAGLGNIYADETLYDAGIAPTRKCEEISEAEAEQIICSARKVMEKSLESGGSTIKNYVKADGTRGDYLDLFAKVYGREGKKCEKCGGEISKTRVAGRGTYYCRRCQK